MTNAQTTARRREAAVADALLTLRWDERAKRWEVTLTNRQGRVLASALADSTVAMDRVAAAVVVTAVRGALEGMLSL